MTHTPYTTANPSLPPLTHRLTVPYPFDKDLEEAYLVETIRRALALQKLQEEEE